MKKRKSEKGAILVMTVGILVFLTSMSALLCDTVYRSTRLNDNTRNATISKRVLTDECYEFLSDLNLGETTNDLVLQTSLAGLPSDITYVEGSFSLFESGEGGTFALSNNSFVATLDFTMTKDVTSLTIRGASQ